MKLSVNYALNKICTQRFEWPFYHVEESLVLTQDQARYPFPTDMKSLKIASFRIPRDTNFNIDTVNLLPLDYEEYLEKYVDAEYTTDKSDIPSHVFRAPDLKFGLYPPPKDAYTLIYDYYVLQPDLENWDDVPTLPSEFRFLIGDGALAYCFQFRGDPESFAVQEQKFMQSLKDMQALYESRLVDVRSGMIVR
jgi:hypothetical protein